MSTSSNDIRREIEAQIDALGPWFHNLHLPDGVQTAPGHRFGDFPRFKWDSVSHAVPDELSGWSVLDIGCNAGFYSLELARRGANVLGIDVETLYLRQAQWAAERCGLQDRLQFAKGQVYQLMQERRQFDLIWFTGVFYHLRYPTLALDIVRRVTKRLMMFQTMTMPGDEVIDTPEDLPLDERTEMLDPGWPKMAFVEHRVADDETNWWAPNHACVEALLRSANFEIVDHPEHEFYLCKPVDGPTPTDLERLLGMNEMRSLPDMRMDAPPPASGPPSQRFA
jgi:tRNA (mo5U34)-methyltransferase